MAALMAPANLLSILLSRGPSLDTITNFRWGNCRLACMRNCR